MSSIALPTSPGPAGFRFSVLDFGGEITPSLGGPVQRINRLGNRYQLEVTLPAMRSRDDAMIWSTRVERAKQNGVLYPVPLDGFDPGEPGSPVISSAVGGGMSVPVSGLVPGYGFVEGQWLSIVHAGRRYLHRAALPMVANEYGTGTLTLASMLRVPLSAGDVIEVAAPKIEGMITSAVGWEALLEPYTKLSFTISESE